MNIWSSYERSPHATADARIAVFIAEDHAITQWGLQRLIDGAPVGMKVVGVASTRQQMLNHPELPAAGVILLDLDLGGEDAGDSLIDLKRCCTGRVLVLTADDDVKRHRALVANGASGIVHKSEPAQTILQAIEKVHRGEVWLNRGLLGEVLRELTSHGRAPSTVDVHSRRIASLTKREHAVIQTIVRLVGAKQMSVAHALDMSEHTLRNHLTTIYSKLVVHGRLELHLYATRHGLAPEEHAVGKP